MDNTIYYRKLNEHELGYRRGQPGGAGRYIYIAKKHNGFFPHLSETNLNDSLYLKLIPPFSNDTVVLSRFIYHNDSFIRSEGTRDEMRLYLNNEIDPDRNYFKANDIVLFQKFRTTDGDLIYKLYRFDSTSEFYSRLEEIAENFKISAPTHALIPVTELSFLELLHTIDVENVEVPEDVREAALVEEEIPEDIGTEEDIKLLRSNSFRDLVMFFYDYKCAVTGEKYLIRYENLNNLDAAHIKAHSSGGPGHARNGMPLSKNYHWAYDNGFFTLRPDYTIEVHKDVIHIPTLAEINNNLLVLPMDSRAHPNPSYIEWHRENVFGLFLRKF